ncbi:MAG: LysR family transcriptional regulator [Pseudomonadota bacterium]
MTLESSVRVFRMYGIEDLRTFVAIAGAGGVTAGARRLGVSPATASHRLSKLEAALQLTLYHRNSRVMRLTAEGQVFLERVDPILADLAQAVRDAGGGAAALSGHLRITMSRWILSRFILPALPAFRDAHPKLTFEFLAVDRFVSLAAEGQDCAIRIGQLEDSALVARKLSENERIICAAPEFLARHGPITDPATLATVPWVSLPWQRHVAIKDAAGRRRHVRAESAVLVSNSDMLTDGAVQGLGLAVKSRLAIQAELRSGRVVEVLPGTLWDPSAPIWFVFSSEVRAGQKAQVFGDFAERAFQRLRAADEVTRLPGPPPRGDSPRRGS